MAWPQVNCLRVFTYSYNQVNVPRWSTFVTPVSIGYYVNEAFTFQAPDLLCEYRRAKADSDLKPWSLYRRKRTRSLHRW